MCKELEMTKGSGTMVGSIGYMEQSPWIMNDTMRANILFGRDFDEEYYWKVIHACALTQDLESWPDSDLTTIGERGINISGGQRARLALARTVYSQADIYILDDPLSAVDAHVKRHILDNVILSSGLLGNKLRVIITHSESMLPFCNQIITVSDKTVSVIHQEPKEYFYIAPVAAVESNDVFDPILTETDLDSTPRTPTIDNDAQVITSDDAPSECSESDEDQLPQQKRTILDNAKYVFRLCEKIGIVGRTGAGKSTLAKAIFRLLNKNVEGSIEIDGYDTAKFGVGDFRPKLGIIPQESSMFSGTIKRNLDPLYEFTIEDMWAAMIKCGVAELIDPNRKRKPARSASQISIASNNANGNTVKKSEIEDDEDEKAKSIRLRWENAGLMMRALLLLFAGKPELDDRITPKTGINKYLIRDRVGFSNGQQQLFSLCRLLMRKRKVMILDEATADVDMETDRKMQELIRSEFSDSTIITIAHRLDTIMNSDRIIVMEKGEIVEIGPPQELRANGGKFAELVQANEF
ncbi:hypothetical protein GGI19_004694 [Coemansia pectinata]|uniref:ABC transporter domain-containing protein n=1 Tax=Coemansia pectinata TaxID=1052879 RepID=A0A9W8LAB7_9FUNG|nr:hypothetical protein GGI19_004694 [Coemansia pectinata]